MSKTLQVSLPPLKVKQKEIPLFNNPTESVELGTPNLGTVWVIEFVTVTFAAVTGINKSKAKAEVKSELVVKLFEDNFVFASNRKSANLPFIEPEESQSIGQFEVGFNFPQPPRVNGGHSLTFEYVTTLNPVNLVANGLSSINFTEGQISIGYELVNNHSRRKIHAHG